MPITTLALLVSLSFDTFAVAVGLAVAGLPRQRWIAVGLTFALFEAVMPLIGLMVGRRLSASISEAAPYVAGLTLIALGARELYHAIRNEGGEADDRPRRVLQGGPLIVAGLSVSIDELAVGFSLGVLPRVAAPLGAVVVYLGLQALVATFAGLTIGARAGRRLGERAELVAALTLAGLGAAIIIGEAVGVRV